MHQYLYMLTGARVRPLYPSPFMSSVWRAIHWRAHVCHNEIQRHVRGFFLSSVTSIVKMLYSFRRLRRAGQEALNAMARGADFHTILSKEAVLSTGGLLRNDGAWEQEFRR